MVKSRILSQVSFILASTLQVMSFWLRGPGEDIKSKEHAIVLITDIYL